MILPQPVKAHEGYVKRNVTVTKSSKHVGVETCGRLCFLLSSCNACLRACVIKDDEDLVGHLLMTFQVTYLLFVLTTS